MEDEWNGVDGWNGMEWMEWNGNGLEWNGMEWNGQRRSIGIMDHLNGIKGTWYLPYIFVGRYRPTNHARCSASRSGNKNKAAYYASILLSSRRNSVDVATGGVSMIWW